MGGFNIEADAEVGIGGKKYDVEVDANQNGVSVDIHEHKDKGGGGSGNSGGAKSPTNSAIGKHARAYVTGRFVLELDIDRNRLPVGALVSVDGGAFKSEAVGEKVGFEGLETRSPGRQKFDDITIQVGTAMSPKFWDWLKKSVDNKYQRYDGAIVAYDYDDRERSRREFHGALISEIQFPALDAKAKQPATLTVKIAPETMAWTEGNKDHKLKMEGNDPKKQKLWVPANFRFVIDGFEDNLKWVQKVEQFSIKQNIIQNPIGNEKYVRREVGRVEYPNIAFHLPETHAKPWLKYWKEFVGEMKHDHEYHGSITYLATDCRTELMTVEFEGAGITSVSFDKHEAQSDQVRMVKVELYTEGMRLKGEPKATY